MVAGGYSHGRFIGPFILGIVAILQQERPTAPLWREVQQRCRSLRFSVSIAKVRPASIAASGKEGQGEAPRCRQVGALGPVGLRPAVAKRAGPHHGGQPADGPPMGGGGVRPLASTYCQGQKAGPRADRGVAAPTQSAVKEERRVEIAPPVLPRHPWGVSHSYIHVGARSSAP